MGDQAHLEEAVLMAALCPFCEAEQQQDEIDEQNIIQALTGAQSSKDSNQEQISLCHICNACNKEICLMINVHFDIVHDVYCIKEYKIVAAKADDDGSAALPSPPLSPFHDGSPLLRKNNDYKSVARCCRL